MTPSASLVRAMGALRAHALAYPGTVEEFPWGHRAIKIKAKTFVFLALEGSEFSMSVKLPGSSMAALMLPFASPTGYGLGRSGWVTAAFGSGDRIPVDLLMSWIDESFRAIAPRSVVREILSEVEPTAVPKRGGPNAAATKRPGAKKRSR